MPMFWKICNVTFPKHCHGMPICCPIITQLRYNLASIILFLQHSAIAPSLFPLEMKRTLFSRTYSLKLDAIQQVRVTAEKNEGYRSKVRQPLIREIRASW